MLTTDGVLTHKSHVPTGRVPLEEVIRFAVTELGVKPLSEEWADVLRETEGAFRRFQTWP